MKKTATLFSKNEEKINKSTNENKIPFHHCMNLSRPDSECHRYVDS